ncbi:MAG: hypothetical protein IT324_19345 [Anaerolineae bacterium]|nr:hypothetical protein [Anaerolineae bacterium]
MANRYEVQPDVAIRIQTISGDLDIKGRTATEIRARGDDPQVVIGDDGHSAIVSCSGDCRLDVPNGASVSIETVGGDARIAEIEGKVTITTVGGDLAVRRTGDVSINTIGSDADFKRINGGVQVTTIGSDVELSNINGNIQIETIGSDAQIKNVAGSCEIEEIGSDLILNTRFDPSAKYYFDTIGSDILIAIRPEDDVRINYPKAVEAAVEVDYASMEQDDDVESIVLGHGAAVVQLENPGGSLRLVEDSEDLGGFIEDMIPENLDEIINEQLERHIPDIQRKAEQAAERLRQRAEREAEKAQQHAERVRQDAERKAERMRQEAERHAERARREAERQAERMQRQAERMAEHGKHKRKRGFGFEFSWPGGPGPIPPIPPIPPMPFGFRGEKPKRDAGPARPQGEPVSNDERMAILRMVEEKRITVEEAERLLAALEG